MPSVSLPFTQMTLPVYLVSRSTLEPWNKDTPKTTGIGGSETAHIETAERLGKRGYKVESYIPLSYVYPEHVDGNVTWLNADNAPGDLEDEESPCIVINYRDFSLFDRPKPPNQRWWFVAQDVDYPWLQPNLEKVDRYLCLSKAHVNYTLGRYPFMKDKIYRSSNGIRTDYITEFEKRAPARIPYRCFYPSSPDRGLKLLLENWWRVKERFPQATLHVAYGFENMQKIFQMSAGESWHGSYQADLTKLMTQDGVTFLGRLPVDKLLHEWFEASVWPYPNDFAETSCITSMEAQACGAIPVTNALWAVGENVQHGYMIDGVPQKSKLVESLWLGNLYKALGTDMQEPSYINPKDMYTNLARLNMISWARQRYDWERIVDQWEGWLKPDLESLSV